MEYPQLVPGEGTVLLAETTGSPHLPLHSERDAGLVHLSQSLGTHAVLGSAPRACPSTGQEGTGAGSSSGRQVASSRRKSLSRTPRRGVGGSGRSEAPGGAVHRSSLSPRSLSSARVRLCPGHPFRRTVAVPYLGLSLLSLQRPRFRIRSQFSDGRECWGHDSARHDSFRREFPK